MTDVARIEEGRRQAYLAALGIPLWSARVALPGAMVAAPLEWTPYLADAMVSAAGQEFSPPASDVAPSAEPTPVVANPAPSPAIRRNDAPVQAEVSGAAGHKPVASAIDAVMPRLQCRMWTLAPGWTAVIDLGDAPDLAAQEYRLLENVARALGAEEPPGTAGELLTWPLNRNPALDHGPDAMRAWLRHALRMPPGLCLVFGEALAAQIQATHPGRPLIAAPALAALLTDTGAKRRLLNAMAGQWAEGGHV
ncbi:MAG TPA: hypothetical protein VFM34_03035 [Moraxellaceae bacterium]|nr:hypothetical protein [Moraxellaceae bacterium]